MAAESENLLSIQSVIDSFEHLVIIIDKDFNELLRNTYATNLLPQETLADLFDEEERKILLSEERFEFQKSNPHQPEIQLKWISKKINQC